MSEHSASVSNLSKETFSLCALSSIHLQRKRRPGFEPKNSTLITYSTEKRILTPLIGCYCARKLITEQQPIRDTRRISVELRHQCIIFRIKSLTFFSRGGGLSARRETGGRRSGDGDGEKECVIFQLIFVQEFLCGHIRSRSPKLCRRHFWFTPEQRVNS